MGVLDSGVYTNWADLSGVRFLTVDEPPCPDEHGTLVSEILLASTNNGIGFAGAIWGNRDHLHVVALSAEERTLSGNCITRSDLRNVLVLMSRTYGAAVINISLGWRVEDQEVKLGILDAIYCGRNGFLRCSTSLDSNGNPVISGTPGLGTLIVASSGNADLTDPSDPVNQTNFPRALPASIRSIGVCLL